MRTFCWQLELRCSLGFSGEFLEIKGVLPGNHNQPFAFQVDKVRLMLILPPHGPSTLSEMA